MKKFFVTILAAVTACVSLFCLFGCGEENNYDGKYLFSNASAAAGGSLVSITKKDEQGNYVNINHGDFSPENFWVEIKGKTLTVHGSISPVGGGETIKYNVNGDSVRTIENYTLKTYSENESWWQVVDSQGEETDWHILKRGNEVSFEYGKLGSYELWYSIFYVKQS